MAAAMRSLVPAVSGRLKSTFGSIHGATWCSAPPKPKATYAASALMEVSVDAGAVTKVMTCVGP